MKAEELRYKNLIQRKGVVYSVNDIFVASGLLTVLPTESEETLGRVTIHDFEGIELTDEWLRKLGFTPNENAYHTFPTSSNPQKKCYEWYVCEKIVLQNNVDSPPNLSIHYYNSYGNEETETIMEVKFVHQLQNLYFALTGNELTYTL